MLSYSCKCYVTYWGGGIGIREFWRYEGLQFNVMSLTRDVRFPDKKRYITPTLGGAWWLSGRMPDSQSGEPGFEYPLCYRFDVWAFSFSP